MRDQDPSDHPDRVRIRLPTGEEEWVTPEAFNLISEQQFLDSERLRRLRRQRNAAFAAAAVIAVLLGAALLAVLVAGRGDGAAAPGPAASPAVPSAPVPSAPVPMPSEGPEAAPPAAGGEDEGEKTVRAWARAWSARDVERYLAFYAPSFRPPGGLGRAAWEAQRRQRITAPASITVTVSDVEVTRTGEDAASARFVQGYRAPGYRDWVLKTLELARDGDGWRITAERSTLIEAGSAG